MCVHIIFDVVDSHYIIVISSIGGFLKEILTLQSTGMPSLVAT